MCADTEITETPDIVPEPLLFPTDFAISVASTMGISVNETVENAVFQTSTGAIIGNTPIKNTEIAVTPDIECQQARKRIPIILDLLRDVWKAYPEQRLLQLIINTIGTDNDPFYVEDSVLKERLEYVLEQHQQKRFERSIIARAERGDGWSSEGYLALIDGKVGEEKRENLILTVKQINVR